MVNRASKKKSESKGVPDKKQFLESNPFLNQTIIRPKQKGALRSLVFAFFLSFLIFAWEIWGSAQSKSLALLADAGHVVTDSFAFLLSITAVILSERRPNLKMNFGYFRVEVFTAFLNSVLIFGISGFILWEAVERLQTGEKIIPDLMLFYSFGTILLNLVSVWVLSRIAGDNINLKSAYIHVLSDLFATIAVFLGSIVIRFTGWNWVDPILSVLLSFIILKSAWSILKESLSILLEASPTHSEWEHLKKDILETQGVEGILSAHTWSLTKGIHACAFRLKISSKSSSQNILTSLYSLLRKEWEFEQIYLQLEDEKTTEALNTILAKTIHELEPEEWGHSHYHPHVHQGNDGHDHSHHQHGRNHKHTH
ncbi:cobalt transporter [Leptospira perolatii]|uniref:Cobalt transporter n=1 Tax=Leptospira perolatii TaxID=2023191 RepID=A0A2M9ZJR1_9LEPT|nr:cation diffusion facilitator family transporter [Leptospira perolatii]PJZ69470.1 cobalt transporter [Leptospira perolatii]PJZ72295.1 cobalt transporter [Leptospira perolatii]